MQWSRKSSSKRTTSRRPSRVEIFISGFPAEHREEISRQLVRCLFLFFVNFSLWMTSALAFKILEGGIETSFKCGVKRVRRDFVDILWNETQFYDETDWKSSARRKLIEFENELHQAVEAGIHTYSGQTSWTLSNAFVHSFSIAATIGCSRLTPSTSSGRLLLVIYSFLAIPLFFNLLLEMSRLLARLLFVAYKHLRSKIVDSEILKNNQIIQKFSTEVDGWEWLTSSRETFFNQFSIPTVLILPLALVWCVIVAGIYAAVYLSNPVDALYAVVTPAVTVGTVDIDVEDSFFFLVNFPLTIFGVVTFFVLLNSVQGLISEQVDKSLQSMGRLVPSVNDKSL